MQFIPLLLRFWYVPVIAFFMLTTALYKHEAQSNHDQLITYQATADALGKAQEARNRETIARQQKVTDDAAKSYQSRLDIINAQYARLRDEKAAGNRSPMPAIPPTSIPTDDAARDQRLLDVLERAQVETAKLIELQEWVRAVAK